MNDITMLRPAASGAADADRTSKPIRAHRSPLWAMLRHSAPAMMVQDSDVHEVIGFSRFAGRRLGPFAAGQGPNGGTRERPDDLSTTIKHQTQYDG